MSQETLNVLKNIHNSKMQFKVSKGDFFMQKNITWRIDHFKRDITELKCI